MDFELTNDTIRLGFVRHRGRWACRGAGGIWWLAARGPVKVFELARGTCCVVGCDGQARFLSENIDFDTFKALTTRANSELVDDEDC